MSQGGRSERIGFLRAHVARLDTAVGTSPAAAPQRVTFGAETLDAQLGDGLLRAALHEVVACAPADTAAAGGFALALAARCGADRAGHILWVAEAAACREAGLPYAPGLRLHGLDLGRFVFIRARTAPDALWAIEEALKSRACAVVVGELWSLAKAYDLTASRRLVLAAQAGKTPALMLATGLPGRADQMSTGAATRFEVRAMPSAQRAPAGGALPTPGAAAWQVRLAKVRLAKVRLAKVHLAKARAGPDGFDIDRDRFLPLVWDHAEGLFRDALSRPMAAHAGHRPPSPVGRIARSV